MRVVISDLPPEFPVDVTVRDTKLVVSDENDLRFDGVRYLEAPRGGAKNAKLVEGNVATADVELSLRQVVDLFRSARTSEDGYAVLAAEDPAVKLESAEALQAKAKAIAGAGGVIRFSTSRLEGYLAEERFVKEEQRPLREQVS